MTRHADDLTALAAAVGVLAPPTKRRARCDLDWLTFRQRRLPRRIPPKNHRQSWALGLGLGTIFTVPFVAAAFLEVM